jgi:proline iminopeptidase
VYQYRQYNEGFVDVGEGHQIYFAEHGNPTGIPLLVFHGGPGGSTSPEHAELADLGTYRLIRFDQRGTGKSKYSDQMSGQTILKQVNDVENLRQHLGIERWALFGGSYGSTLSSYYRIAHYERVIGHVMLGMFFGDQRGTVHLTEGGGYASATNANSQDQERLLALKDVWDDYASFPQDVDSKYEGVKLVDAYKELVNHEDASIVEAASIRFDRMDISIVTNKLDIELLRSVYSSPNESVTLSRLFFHYATDQFCEGRKEEIITGLRATKSIPTFLVHGGKDHICPVSNAHDISENCPDIAVSIITEAGHSADDRKSISAIESALGGIALRYKEM